MSAQLPGFDSLSYSARFCRRCRATLQPRQGLFGSTRWRCEQCRPSMMLGAIG